MKLVRWIAGSALLAAGRVMADERTYSYSDIDGGRHADLGGILLMLGGLWLLKKVVVFAFDFFSVLESKLQEFLIVPIAYAIFGFIGYPLALYIAKVLDSVILREWVVVLATAGMFVAALHIWIAWKNYQE
jgi:hypothetical protein